MTICQITMSTSVPVKVKHRNYKEGSLRKTLEEMWKKKSEEISRCPENWVLGYQDHKADHCYFFICLLQNLMLYNIWPPSLLYVCDQTPFTLFKGQLVGERYRNHGTDGSGRKDSVWPFIATASYKGLKAPCSLTVELTAPSFYARGHPKYQPETWLVRFELLL